MQRLARHLLPLSGLIYALAGVVIGASRWDGAPMPALGAVAAVAAGLWLARGARLAPEPRQRRALTAASVLVPVALLPHPFQPVAELTALRLLVIATLLDACWTLSWVPSEDDRSKRLRWGWLLATYGAALILAAAPLPEPMTSMVWSGLGLVTLVAASVVRLLRPKLLLQEAAAHHALWSVAATAAIVTALVFIIGLEPALLWPVAAASVAHSLDRAARHLGRGDTSFSSRHAAAPLLVALTVGAAVELIALRGTQWSAAAVVGLVTGAALLAPATSARLRRWLDRLPPPSAAVIEDACGAIEDRLSAQPDLDPLLAALSPLVNALSRGRLGLVSFDPDWTVVFEAEGPALRPSGPGAPLRKLLSTSFHARPLLAEQVVDRAVRQTDLRPASDLIEELSADLITPLPGGDEGALAGALFLGRPTQGRLRGHIGARLAKLARRLGPAIRAAVTVEQAARHIGELERQAALDEDERERLAYQLERLGAENQMLRADRAGTSASEIVGRSPAMRKLLDEVERAATVESPVMIRGEAGTGRTLIARTVHEASDRRDGPFVRYHCAANVPSDHLGALLGQGDEADRGRPGLIELADHGTLLLEEVGALSLDAQAELIRVLSAGEVSSAADVTPSLRPVDVRIIGSTGRSGSLALEQDTILPELHDRLRALDLKVPELAERQSDIVELARFFLDQTVRRHGLEVEDFSPDALEALEGYQWPGNVRQLRAVVEQAALFAEGQRITTADLPALERTPATPQPSQPDLLEGTFDEIERAVLLHALDQAQGNKAEAARRLGMKRTTFSSRLRRYVEADAPGGQGQ